MKAQRQILRVSWTTKKTNSWVLEHAGRCQQEFTGKCEKQEARIFRSRHPRRSQTGGKGHYSKNCLGIGKEEDRTQRGWIMSLHGRD